MADFELMITSLAGFVRVLSYTLSVIGLVIFTIYGSILYLNRSYRVVRMRGLYQLQFLLWSLAFVSFYTLFQLFSYDFGWSFYFIWLVINLRRWSILFSMLALFAFQLLLASMKVPGRVERKICGVSLTTEKPQHIDRVLRRLVFYLVFSYCPVLVINFVMLGLIPNIDVQGVSFVIEYILLFLYFVFLLLLIHVYLGHTQHLPIYYSHRRTYLVICTVTDIIVVIWFSLFVWSEAQGFSYFTSQDHLESTVPVQVLDSVDASFCCLISLVWVLLYISQPVICLLLAYFGRPEWRDSYQISNFHFDGSSSNQNPVNSRNSKPSTIDPIPSINYIEENTLSGWVLMRL
jgi:hypothetical protein